MGLLEKLIGIDFIFMDKSIDMFQKRLDDKTKENMELKQNIQNLKKRKEEYITNISFLKNSISNEREELEKVLIREKKDYLCEMRAFDELNEFIKLSNSFRNKYNDLSYNILIDMFE